MPYIFVQAYYIHFFVHVQLNNISEQYKIFYWTRYQSIFTFMYLCAYRTYQVTTIHHYPCVSVCHYIENAHKCVCDTYGYYCVELTCQYKVVLYTQTHKYIIHKSVLVHEYLNCFKYY